MHGTLAHTVFDNSEMSCPGNTKVCVCEFLMQLVLIMILGWSEQHIDVLLEHIFML